MTSVRVWTRVAAGAATVLALVARPAGASPGADAVQTARTFLLPAGSASRTFTMREQAGVVLVNRVIVRPGARVVVTAAIPHLAGARVTSWRQRRDPALSCRRERGLEACTQQEEWCPLPAATWRFRLEKLAGPAGPVRFEYVVAPPRPAGAPARPHLHAQTVALHAAPIALTFADRRLWVVAERPTGPVVVLRVGGGATAPTTVAWVGRQGPDLGAVAAGDGFLWAAAGMHLARISPASPYGTRRAALPGEATGVAVGAGHIWVTTVGARNLLLGFDPRTLRIERRIQLPSPVSRLVYGLGSLWTVDERGLARIDTRTGRRTPIGLIGAPPTGVALVDGKAWAFAGAGIVALSPTGRETWQARLPVHGGAFAVGGTVAWAADDCGCPHGTLVAYDLRRRRLLARLRTGTIPSAIAATAHTAWVANFESETLTEVRR